MHQDVVRLIISRLADDTTAQLGTTKAERAKILKGASGGMQRHIAWQEKSCGNVISEMFKIHVPNSDRAPTYKGDATLLPTGGGSRQTKTLSFGAPKPHGARQERRLLTNDSESLNLFEYHVPDPNGGKSFILIWETEDAQLWLRLANETELTDPRWDERIRKAATELATGKASRCISFSEPPTANAMNVIARLAQNGAVLLSGPPGTGKSRLMAQVRQVFELGVGAFRPSFDSTGAVIEAPRAFPLPMVRTDRKTFSFPMHQKARSGDLLTRLLPSGANQWSVEEGPLYKAAEHGRSAHGHALLLLDELNRGPAAEVIGPAMVAFDKDARLAADGSEKPTTQKFPIYRPRTPTPQALTEEYALPEHLWILAGRNTSDTSAISLDSALLRRFHEIRLSPDMGIVRKYYGLEGTDDPWNELLKSLLSAVEQINLNLVRLGMEGARIGHGVLMTHPRGPVRDIATAQRIALDGWARIETHLTELFKNDDETLAGILSVAPNRSHPLSLVEYDFAGRDIIRIEGMDTINANTIKALLDAIASKPMTGPTRILAGGVARAPNPHADEIEADDAGFKA